MLMVKVVSHGNPARVGFIQFSAQLSRGESRGFAG